MEDYNQHDYAVRKVYDLKSRTGHPIRASQPKEVAKLVLDHILESAKLVLVPPGTRK